MNRKIIMFPYLLLLILILSGCNDSLSLTSSKKPQKTYTQGTKVVESKRNVGGETVSSWEILQPDGSMDLAGLTLSLKTIEHIQDLSNSMTLDFPNETKTATFVDHVDVQYGEKGFTQDLNESSLSLRFYTIPGDQESSIACTGIGTLDMNQVPDGYIEENCIPHIGNRMVVKNIVQDPDHPTQFARLNFGFDRGNMAFIEPVVTIEKLLRRESFTLSIPTPTKISRQVLFPTTFTGVYQPSSDSYDFSILGFTDLNSLSQ